jgi:dipeptidyl aminopeptidase/acylaminoacyl peptidase/predicted Ser/Thr protein kinase
MKPGRKLLHYQLVDKIGEGGMGIVWKALDTTLNREVAIKVLPAVFAHDGERLARFEREAKLLASLNHPNIASVYGLHESEDVRFLAMEFIEGEDLLERLKRGRMKVEEALRVARQIADALQSAHESGVVHRDLKPANVLLSAGGKAKVLDFGLAKAFEPDLSAQVNPSMSPTLTSHGTIAGMIMGTAGYMSPEQARGDVADKRADVWAFGVVLYEMLSGGRAFHGDTVSDTLASVLKLDPDWDALPVGLPRGIQRLLRRSLQKEPRRRLHDIADARIEIDEALAAPLDSTMVVTGSKPERTRWLLTAVLAGLALAGGLAIGRMLAHAPPDRPVRRFFVPMVAGEGGSDLDNARISPNGKTIAYTLGGKLWLRDLDALAARPIESSGAVDDAVWSPDSTQVAYRAKTKLWRVPVERGTPTLIGEVGEAFSMTWATEQTIFLSTLASGIRQVSALGGEVTLALNNDEDHYHDLTHLPDGRGLVIVVHSQGGDVDTLAVWSKGVRKTVLQIDGAEISDPYYVASGHVLFSRTQQNVGTWALPFSLDRLEATGDPFLVVPEGFGSSVSVDGTLIGTHANPVRELELVWLDASGEVQGTIGRRQDRIMTPALSPDGTRVAVSGTQEGDWDIWVHDIERRTKTPLTFAKGQDRGPQWSADGETVFYFNKGSKTIYRVAADGSGEPEAVTQGTHPTLSADTTRMVFVREGEASKDDLWTLDLEGGSEPEEFLQTDANENNPSLSPDGSFLAYTSDVSGSQQIYVKPYPSGRGRWQASVNGGKWPRWSISSDRLYFIAENSSLTQVSFSASPSVVLGTPETVADSHTSGFAVWPRFAVVPDGRFIVVRGVEPEHEEEPVQGIFVVENWFTEFE